MLSYEKGVDMLKNGVLVEEVANYYLRKENEEEYTNLRLNKMIYIAFGWASVILDSFIFDDRIEAWKYGPVIPAIYHEFKHFGSNIITTCKATVFNFEKGSYSPEIRNDDIKEILNNVEKEYKDFATVQLIDITHRKGTPWFETYDEDYNNEINKDLIKQYYLKQSKS